MRQWVRRGVVGLFVLLICSGFILFPEWIAGWRDDQYIDQFKLYPVERSSDILSTMSMAERLEILSQVDINDLNYIFSVYSYDDWIKSDESITDKLIENVEILEEKKVIPVISKAVNWEAFFISAELYNLYLPENPGKVLPVWRLIFEEVGEDGLMLSLTLDADLYLLYEVSLYGTPVYEYETQQLERYANNLDDWINDWTLQYGLYLDKNCSAKGETVGEYPDAYVPYEGALSIDGYEYYIDACCTLGAIYDDPPLPQWENFYFRPLRVKVKEKEELFEGSDADASVE